LFHSPTDQPPPTDETILNAVAEATQAAEDLNDIISHRSGARANAPRPGLIPTTDELFVDPPPPSFPLVDDEIELIRMVSTSSFLHYLAEMISAGHKC
jgi:hypothetical protein